jgi:hypothetical protein
MERKVVAFLKKAGKYRGGWKDEYKECGFKGFVHFSAHQYSFCLSSVEIC